MTLLVTLLILLAVLLCLPVLLAVPVLFLQVLAYSRNPLAQYAEPALHASMGSVVVLVPAHDEASGISEALATMLPQLGPGDRLLVVADNCADDTAAKARAAGAEVVERISTLRGKGYALAFGIDHLRAKPPAAVVIVDADCKLAPNAIAALTVTLAATHRPVQALYLMLAPSDAGLGRRLSQFAWRVRNQVRPSGWHRLGMPCQLMGTGMAFSWDMLRDAPLANASIVEDMKLGIDLALRGTPPVFCDNALVTSVFPDSIAASNTQRTRWEHGHMEMIMREVPTMLRAALGRKNRLLMGLALDLYVPPLALLAGLAGSAWLLAAAGWFLGGGVAALALTSTLLGIFLASILVGWWRAGRDLVDLVELLTVPWYILSKMGIYLRFIGRRQKTWVRTDRK